MKVYNLFSVEGWHGVNKVFDAGMGILAFWQISFFPITVYVSKMLKICSVYSVQTDLMCLQVV